MIIETKEFQIGLPDNFKADAAGKVQGWFESKERGDEEGGGLWITDGELTDYDGTWALPREVGEKLRELGVVVDDINFA